MCVCVISISKELVAGARLATVRSVYAREFTNSSMALNALFALFRGLNHVDIAYIASHVMVSADDISVNLYIVFDFTISYFLYTKC